MSIYDRIRGGEFSPRRFKIEKPRKPPEFQARVGEDSETAQARFTEWNARQVEYLTDLAEWETALKAHQREDNAREARFSGEVFAELGWERNPITNKLYDMALNRRDGFGLEDVWSILQEYDELYDIIKSEMQMSG